MCLDRHKLRQIIAAANLKDDNEEVEELVARITSVIQVNVTRGRLETFLAARQEYEPEAYYQHVVENFHQNHAIVNGLQVERDSLLWENLYHCVQSWVYNYLIRRGFMPNEGTFRQVENYTSFAVEQLLKAHFPYDIQFERWARTVVQNVCRKHITSDTRQKCVPDKRLVGLEQWQPGPLRSASAHSVQEELLGSLDIGEELMAALRKLPAASRVVIQLRYFDGMDYPEIAAYLARTTKAVYNLHFKGIKRLREILTADGYNIIHGSKQSIRRGSRQPGTSPRPTGPDGAE